MTGAQGLEGGIANTNLNVLRTLVNISKERKLELEVLSFCETENDRPGFLPSEISFRAFWGRKLQFAFNLLKESAPGKIFIFDHVSLALPLLPLSFFKTQKIIIFAHGSESWKRIRPLSRLLFEKASLCIINSEFTLKKMRQHIPKFNGIACPLGLSPDFPLNPIIPAPLDKKLQFRAADGTIKVLGPRFFLLVARMDPREGQKGHRQLIEILPELLKRYPGTQLVFAGSGEDQRNIQQLALEKKAGSSVFLPGRVSLPELQFLYQSCYAFVMPSQQEGFGLVYLEAMNFAKPCVGCFDQGAEDIIVHGETGFLVHDPNNREELLSVLSRFLSSSENAGRLGKNGFHRLHQFFTAEHYQNRIQDALLKVIK